MLNFYSLLIALRTSPSEDQEKVEALDLSYSCAIENLKVDSENVVSHTVLTNPHLDDINFIETIIDGLFREMYRIGDIISYESTAKTKILSKKVRSKVSTYYETNFERRDSIELLIHVISILDLIPNLDQAEEDEKRLFICLEYIYTKAKEIIDVCIDLVDPKHPELSNRVQRRLLTSLRGLTDALH